MSILSKLKDKFHLKPFFGKLKTASAKKEPIPVPKPIKPKEEEK